MTDLIPTVTIQAKWADGQEPTYAHPTDAGMDLYSTVDVTLIPRGTAMVPTGFWIDLPEGYVGLVHPRSGLARKGVTVANSPGTIDSGYQGEVKVLLINNSNTPVRLEAGSRIAQLVVQEFVHVNLKRVGEFDQRTTRGEKGFGSTGS